MTDFATNTISKPARRTEFISVHDFRNATKNAWATLERDGKVVITNNGKERIEITFLVTLEF